MIGKYVLSLLLEFRNGYKKLHAAILPPEFSLEFLMYQMQGTPLRFLTCTWKEEQGMYAHKDCGCYEWHRFKFETRLALEGILAIFGESQFLLSMSLLQKDQVDI